MSLNQNEAVHNLVNLIEEAARANEEGIKRFIEPASNTLNTAKSKRHHIIFGRRGSGKSSLLRKAAADLTVDRRPIAYVDLETFKGHSYPDVLVSVLIASFDAFATWLETAAIHPANKSTFWDKLFGAKPKRNAFNRGEAAELAIRLRNQIEVLQTVLHSADNAELISTQRDEHDDTTKAAASGNIGTEKLGISMNASVSNTNNSVQEFQEKYSRNKTDFLHRHIIDYQKIFRDIAELSDGSSFLFLDDLYHIRRTDQSRVIDYFHRIAKGNKLWLKIGTIRHRTDWYLHGDPPIGLKLGDDANEIDLDLTLEKYATTKNFLQRVLERFILETDIPNLDSLINPTALDRLVVASGGVARDFLNLFNKSVQFTSERLFQNPESHRGERISAEDVNNASGEYETSKREELKRDTNDNRDYLENEFERIRDFCREQANSNLFLIPRDADSLGAKAIQELVDLRLIHKVNSRVSVPGKTGQFYEAYMLDVSQYTGSRAIRGFTIHEFWIPANKDNFRRVSLIYEPTV